MNREQWKTAYRLLRTARREAAKARRDALLYGSGVVRIYGTEFVHVRMDERFYFSAKTAARASDWGAPL